MCVCVCVCACACACACVQYRNYIEELCEFKRGFVSRVRDCPEWKKLNRRENEEECVSTFLGEDDPGKTRKLPVGLTGGEKGDWKKRW